MNIAEINTYPLRTILLGAFLLILSLNPFQTAYSQTEDILKATYSEDERKALEWFEEVKNLWDGITDERDIERKCEGMYPAIQRYGKKAQRLNSYAIKDAIMNFPDYHPLVTEGKIFALWKVFDMPGVHDYIISSLNSKHDNVQIAATTVLVACGDWGIAKPFVQKHELYCIVRKYEVIEATDMLFDALKNGSWDGKMHAAYALEDFGYPEAKIEVVEDILKNAPSFTEDRSINRNVKSAIKIAKTKHLTNLVPYFYRFTGSPNEILRQMATGALMFFMREDYSTEARDLLVKVHNETSDPAIKERLSEFLSEHK